MIQWFINADSLIHPHSMEPYAFIHPAKILFTLQGPLWEAQGYTNLTVVSGFFTSWSELVTLCQTKSLS